MKNRQTNRQQYSACGACRARRVYCDLKDICAEALSANIPPVCSSCRDRNFICRYEFDNSKAAKLLRRGRRVREVEKLYGRSSSSPTGSGNSPLEESQSDFPIVLHQDSSSASPPRSIIPALHPQFFESNFFRRFHIQHPILDPQEFSSRYSEHYEHSSSAETLGPAGYLIAKLLVIWAFSFGVDECGQDIPSLALESLEERRKKCNSMIQEVIGLVDAYGILRKSSYDGVRALLLLYALDQDLISSSQPSSQVMHHNIMSHVSILCILTTTNFEGGTYGDGLVRSHIYWYAHIRESITLGLRGDRLFLSEDDLDNFIYNVPAADHLAVVAGPPSPSDQAYRYNLAHRLSRLPLQISAVCRRIHACLTGPKIRRAHRLDEMALRDVVNSLETLWFTLDRFRTENQSHGDMLRPEECDQYSSSWQIFIFECYYHILLVLQRRASSVEPSEPLSLSPSGREQSQRLSAIVHHKCLVMLQQHFIPLIRRLIKTRFFAFDAGLAKGGLLAAANFVAENGKNQEDFNICLAALKQLRWVYAVSPSEDSSLQAAWSDRNQPQPPALQSQTPWSSPPLLGNSLLTGVKPSGLHIELNLPNSDGQYPQFPLYQHQHDGYSIHSSSASASSTSSSATPPIATSGPPQHISAPLYGTSTSQNGFPSSAVSSTSAGAGPAAYSYLTLPSPISPDPYTSALPTGPHQPLTHPHIPFYIPSNSSDMTPPPGSGTPMEEFVYGSLTLNSASGKSGFQHGLSLENYLQEH